MYIISLSNNAAQKKGNNLKKLPVNSANYGKGKVASLSINP